MRFTITTGLTSLLLASSCRAVVVSEDQADGLYVASSDGKRSMHLLYEYNGTEIDSRASDGFRRDHQRRSPSSSLSGRDPLPWVKTGCSDNIRMDGVNYDQAKAQFGIYCDSGEQMGPNGGLYYKFGSAIAFSCSWGGSQGCSTQEYTDAMTLLDKDCQQLVPGWVEMDDWKKIYGRTTVGEAFCGDGWD